MSDSEVEFPPNEEQVALLRERYRCPHFRILVIGRANAGKTTILEKVCRVARGTIPIIYDKEDKLLKPTLTHLIPSIERGLHDIEHQITYKGSNFIFHDSQGFESGATDELNVAWGFIDKKSAESELRNQLHAIWYCIPMDSPRPLLHSELQFFQKGTGKVPLVVVFTKFDGQIVNEYVNMKDAENYEDKWDLARVKADDTFQRIYLPKVLDTEYPPKAFVRLADMDLDENDCPELTEQTAGALDDDIIQQLFISTQMNNLDLCVKTALQHTLSSACRYDTWIKQTPRILNKFPHYWIDREDAQDEINWFEEAKQDADDERDFFAEGTHWHNISNNIKFDKYENDPGFRGGGSNEDQFFFGEQRDKIFSVFFSMFGGKKTTKFSPKPSTCQIIVAMIIICKLSFWINKPFKYSIIEALDQFKSQGYEKKLKNSITSQSLPKDKEELLNFLYDLIKDKF